MLSIKAWLLISSSIILLSTSSIAATLLIFTGSDWCPNCRRLGKKILSDSTFISYTKNKLSIEFVDFPQHKKLDPQIVKKNKILSEKYHFQGIYPTILLLDSAGKVIGQIFYLNQSPKEFIDNLKLLLKD